ncbi:hypothetical protein JX266_012806 [Neoarthrinium moseri]|nr:hypothetical protein JX266_012806 [Neoarthrinium moseri]
MRLSTFSVGALALTSPVLATFGYSKSGSNYVIDAGSSEPLVFSVSSTSCDINSIKYRGTELQYKSKGSHISSGLGTATVSVATVNTKYIKITCVTDTLTQYMVVASGESRIYMATYITAEPSIGELRFITRLNPNPLSDEYPYGPVSTTAGSSSTVEGSDVFLVNGQTRSKFYSSTRFIDRDAQCVLSSGSEAIHACMLHPEPGMESSSGGPFFRDIETNNGGDSTNLYNYMNSGHTQTEANRVNVLHGPYVLDFSRSGVSKSTDLNLAFLGDLSIMGFVPASGRGYVSGTASGVPSTLEAVVHWYNSAAQYWVKASTSGSFTSPAMKPGTYTMVLYQAEFKVASVSGVAVSAGKNATQNIASGLKAPKSSLWKIGEYDGQPAGFLNADKQPRMHPSDTRMSSWTAGTTYTVGSSTPSQFPMALFKDVNSPVTVKFSLASAPGAATLRVATTLAFQAGRPQVKVNGWNGPNPAAPTKIDSRGVTRGTYRGYGEVYDFAVPAGTLVKGDNTVVISSLSGSSGKGFLSSNFIFDCVELFTN